MRDRTAASDGREATAAVGPVDAEAGAAGKAEEKAKEAEKGIQTVPASASPFNGASATAAISVGLPTSPVAPVPDTPAT